MNVFQNIINKITFGLYNPEKKFEQEVLGEATTNLEEVESLRNDVENAVSEYDKYFPNTQNVWNNYAMRDEKEFFYVKDGEYITPSKGNEIVSNLVALEEQLQEQGKYVGMDEETKIKAILAEGQAAEATKGIELESNFFKR